MTRLAPSAAFRARLRAEADRPPLRPRVPLWWQGRRIGSLEPEVFVRAALPETLARLDAQGWHVQGELTASMERIAQAMRDRGVASVWRDEQIALRDEAGAVLGSVERAVVRPLGIPTQAVHLVALDGRGRHWVQQRAFDKPSDPGLWDTVVGGMVPVSEPLDVALERESWEEAGLRREQLLELRQGGSVFLRRPLAEVPHGYSVQELVWYACRLAEGVEPRNQDGEVAEFACLDADEVTRRLEDDLFTVDAAVILLAAFGG
ncbi:MAG TPA: NUDIX domain-containing protein [Ramlibacter sp.]|uniref:NUDIX hydrolase n=1 Tax=Ramlibacter sp. TaxID=1917967 RepID=UPI002ED33131